MKSVAIPREVQEKKDRQIRERIRTKPKQEPLKPHLLGSLTRIDKPVKEEPKLPYWFD